MDAAYGCTATQQADDSKTTTDANIPEIQEPAESSNVAVRSPCWLLIIPAKLRILHLFVCFFSLGRQCFHPLMKQTRWWKPCSLSWWPSAVVTLNRTSKQRIFCTHAYVTVRPWLSELRVSPRCSCIYAHVDKQPWLSELSITRTFFAWSQLVWIIDV